MKQRVQIIVVCGASCARILVEPDGHLRFYTTVKPIRGAANQAVVRMASEYFKVPISRIKIRFGQTSNRKVLEIG